jgi:CRP-like cAMP-binding protein
MFSKLEAFVESFGPLSSDDRNVLRSVLTIQRVGRGHYLWKAGQRCEDIFFVNDGLVRLFFFDERGDEITVHLINDKNFVADPGTFSTSAPLAVSALVEKASEIIMLDRQAQKKLEHEFFDWRVLLRKIVERSLFEKVKLRNRLVQAAAKERFEIFLSTFPGDANYLKAADVASFLGISQFTLSHLKKELVLNDSPHQKKQH